MEAYTCRTCAVQFAPTGAPPDRCPICDDERQYRPPGGQQWTTLTELRDEGHRSELRELEPGLLGIGVQPRVGIGQRAVLVPTGDGNLLWDPPGYLDEAAVAAVRDRGGLSAVAASHPHFYGAMAEWSIAFGDTPMLIPEADREWVMRPTPAVQTWSGTREVAPGVTLVQVGGHFAGSAVVHWADGADRAGALLTGDSVAVAQDRQWATFMRSYPNFIPLPARSIQDIVLRLRPYPFERIYAGWWDSVIEHDARAAVERSAQRYLRWIQGDVDPAAG
jgi:hypothetical protein